jgi:serine/threonine protein kinase
MAIAAGIDVLHECGLIHGDLKSENILVFKDQSGDYVAKVADFGLSIAETVSDTRLSADIGGTRGWQAPEVEHGRSIPRQLWVATDNYSFGLLVWSVLALRGHTPPANQGRQRSIIAMEQIQSLKMQLGNDVWTCLVELLSTLLQEDPSKRPKGLQPLFCRDVYVQSSHPNC